MIGVGLHIGRTEFKPPYHCVVFLAETPHQGFWKGTCDMSGKALSQCWVGGLASQPRRRQNYQCPHATKLCELVSHSFVSSLMGVLFQHLWSVPYFQRPKWVDLDNRIFSWFYIILTSFSKFFNRSRRICQFSKVRLFLKQYRYFADQESPLKLQSRFISPKQRILHRTAD